MNYAVPVISASGLSMLLLEAIKIILRMLFKNPEYDFPVMFYTIMLPILNFLAVPALALLMVDGYTLPTDWITWGRQLVLTVLASLIAVVGYDNTVAKLKAYGRAVRVKAIEKANEFLKAN